MNKNILFLFLINVLLFTACNNNKIEPVQIRDNTVDQTNYSESEQLVYYLEKYGNYINSDEMPALILPEEAHNNIKNPNYYYIDIRPKEEFIEGHIERAYQVDFENLLSYIETEIVVSHYDKIILICHAGQRSSYATGLLRILGYNNIYSLKWGMAGWNKEFSNHWLSNISGNYKELFDTINVNKPGSFVFPEINTGKKLPQDILYARVRELFKKGVNGFKVTRAELLEQKDRYYIVDYIDAFKYDLLHLSGSIQYQPENSLLSNSSLRTLPTNRTIVVYCFTGHKSAFVTAYLKILGYDARSLVFGRNCLIYETLKNKGWPTFSNEIIHNFAYITGEKTINTDDNAKKDNSEE